MLIHKNKKKSQEQSQSPRTCQIDLPNVSIVCEYVADHLRSWNPNWIIGKVLENRENMRNLLHITAQNFCNIMKDVDKITEIK